MNKLNDITIKKIQSWAIFALIIINVLFFIFVLSGVSYCRLDLTEGKKYSVSKPTVDLLRKLDSNLILEYYYNDKCKEHPVMSQIVLYVEDMLKEYERASRGKVNFISKQLSYEKDKDRGDIADLEQFGIKPFSLSERQEAESKTSVGFSGLIIKYKDKQAVMPAIYQDVSFEYNLDSEIKKIADESGSALGVIIGTPNKPFDQAYKHVKYFTANEYKNIEELSPGDNIPNEILTLLVIGGTTLTDYDVFQIDQFLMNGGKAFIALSGLNVIDNPQYGTFGVPNESKLFDLLASYGIKINKNLIGDNESYSPKLQAQGFFYQKYRYPIWPRIKEVNISSEHPAVDELTGLNLFWPSSIDIDEKIKGSTEILFSTTENAWESTENFKLDIDTYKYPIQQGQQKYNMAYAFKGKLESYFKDKPVPENENGSGTFSGNKLLSGDAQMIVVGNDILFDSQYIGEEEMLFLLNSLDWLSTENSLIKIRNKGKFLKPLDKAINDKQKDSFKSFIIIFTTFFVPLLFIVLAVVLNFLRRSRNIKLIEKYNKKK